MNERVDPPAPPPDDPDHVLGPAAADLVHAVLTAPVTELPTGTWARMLDVTWAAVDGADLGADGGVAGDVHGEHPEHDDGDPSPEHTLGHAAHDDGVPGWDGFDHHDGDHPHGFEPDHGFAGDDGG